MALSFVGGNNGTAGGGADVTLTLTVGVATNDYVLVAGTVASTSDLNLAMVTADYQELADLYQNDLSDCNFGVFRKIMGATPDSDAVIENLGPGTIAGAFHIWRGVNTTTPEDATTTTGGAIDSGTPDPPSIDTVTANAVVIACAGSSEGDAVTNAPTGYTNLFDAQSGAGAVNVMMSSKSVASPGTEDPGTYADVVGSTSDSWAAATVALRPAAGAVPTEPANVSVTFTLATCGAGR